jgi:DNA-binding response OmpR family regulator
MSRKILVTDDDPAIRDVFKIIFENAGYEVEIKSNANDLLKLNSNFPDLFLIDRLLSGVDGIEVCKHLKNQSATKDIPIIIISASPDARKLAKDAGADDFIEKPFGVATLLKKVEQILESKQGNAPDTRKKPFAHNSRRQ